jgi:hypothetical protein
MQKTACREEVQQVGELIPRFGNGWRLQEWRGLRLPRGGIEEAEPAR